MLRIVAIGGGSIGRSGTPAETNEIDAVVVGLTEKRHGRVLFVGTASRDDLGYFEAFKAQYGVRLGCEVHALRLYDRTLDDEDIVDQIRRADIVYVGGGNTPRMMNLWRRRGIDRLLRTAAHEGAIMAGVSAGAICWANRGVSDTGSSSDGKPSLIAIRGLGLIDVTICPHFQPDGFRNASMQRIAARANLPALGIPDGTVLQVDGDNWRVLSSRIDASAQWVSTTGEIKAVASERFAPLDTLLGR